MTQEPFYLAPALDFAKPASAKDIPQRRPGQNNGPIINPSKQAPCPPIC